MGIMRRRDFIKILAGSTFSPSVAAAQGRAVPVIGFLVFQTADPKVLAKFRQGLNEWGYFEGRNVVIEYRWGLNQKEELPALAAELVQRRVALIVTTGGSVGAKAAKDATDTIPILFTSGLNPVENGIVASFNRPGGNVTGLSLLNAELLSKRLELLRQLVPGAAKIAHLMNDDSTGLGPSETKQQEAERQIAGKLGLVIHYARNESAIETAFAAMVQQRSDALLVASDPLFGHQRAQLVALAARYALPASYSRREFADAGGLMSYGPSITETWRQLGEYAGRLLKGARPQDLPVQLQNKYELVINMKTAKALGLSTPPLLHALADDVIEWGRPMDASTRPEGVALPTLRSRLFRKYATLFVLAVGVALLASGMVEAWTSYRDHTAWLVRIQRASGGGGRQDRPIHRADRSRARLDDAILLVGTAPRAAAG
jgi:putative ABC transport system substrate-binding protein